MYITLYLKVAEGRDMSQENVDDIDKDAFGVEPMLWILTN